MRILLHDLCKHFGDVRAVEQLTLEIGEGEFVALLGPSGCGKTTTLFTIAGFYKPTSGEVRFNGRVVNDLPPRERNIGMVFQSYALYPHMRVFDNIAFPLKIKKVPKKLWKAKVLEVAKLLKIADLMERLPGQLSGGQQQRVALARALVKEPDLLLLDEPLSNLDAKLRISMRAELKRLQRNLGITTIFVTHDQVEAMTMADRIALLKEGRLEQVGTPEELYNSPATLFAAEFIGTTPMNFVDVSLEEVSGRLFVTTEHFRFPLMDGPEQKVRRLIGHNEAVLGIRPEDITIGHGEISGEIYVVEPLGRDTLVTLRVGNTEYKVFGPPGFRGAIGEQVRFTFSTERIQIFDKSTGGRMRSAGTS